MALIDLIRKRDDRRRRRARQFKKWRKTGKQGHLKAFNQHNRAVQKLSGLITSKRKELKGPRIITAADQGIFPVDLFGPLGVPAYVTGHYTAGPKDKSVEHAIEMNQSYDDYHRSQGWGGIGYHYNIARDGTILCLRPVAIKGAHVGAHNSNNVGIMCHGTTGDEPSQEQRDSYKWLLQNAHTSKMSSAHRTSRPLTGLPRYGHNDWSSHEYNSCPGAFKPMYKGEF
jgi:hypothetical protein